MFQSDYYNLSPCLPQTSLLMTILGELPIQSGSIRAQGKIAYVSQHPWIFSGSLRQNILFGESFEKARYDKIIRISALSRVTNLYRFLLLYLLQLWYSTPFHKKYSLRVFLNDNAMVFRVSNTFPIILHDKIIRISALSRVTNLYQFLLHFLLQLWYSTPFHKKYSLRVLFNDNAMVLRVSNIFPLYCFINFILT